MKKVLLLGLCAAMVMSMAGCTGDDSSSESSKGTSSSTAKSEVEQNTPKTFDVAGWQIVYENCMVESSLENASVSLGYAEVETNNFEKKAEDGKTFCLIKLKITKNDSSEIIDWSKFKLVDSDGNEYTREEDSFITDLGMIRMTGDNLNFGENEGWICYQIPKEAKDLKIVYPFSSDKLEVEL